ncbi:hypothetical protein [Streptomyces sp. DG1A-41]
MADDIVHAAGDEVVVRAVGGEGAEGVVARHPVVGLSVPRLPRRP